MQSRGYTVVRIPDTEFYGPLSDGMIGAVRDALTVAEHAVASTNLASLHPIQLALPFNEDGMVAS